MNTQSTEDISEKSRLASPTIYEIVAKEGREELERPFQSLAWSGLVAGICISFSLVAEGLLRAHLPHGGGFYLIENLGYTVGFIIVILGRFQLFTENTVTVILPLLERFTAARFFRTMNLWAIVLASNFVGTFLFAFLISYFSFFPPEQLGVFLEISEHAVIRDLDQVFIQAIPAGFLIAALVWMLPSADTSKVLVVALMTYLIAIGDFTHIIAGSTEAFLLVLNGHASVSQISGYLLMACLGNVIGGTGLFALTAYAQVREEM